MHDNFIFYLPKLFVFCYPFSVLFSLILVIFIVNKINFNSQLTILGTSKNYKQIKLNKTKQKIKKEIFEFVKQNNETPNSEGIFEI